jgi:hypothetical protein
MRPDDVARLAHRDWDAVDASKTEQWLHERQRRGIPWCLRIAEELRRQVVRQRAEWPSAEERETDLATHVRVSEALRRVARARRDH